MLNDVLGSLKKYHERTLFGKDVPQKAADIDGYYVIQISPIDNMIRGNAEYYGNNGYNTDVLGLLEKFPEFSINANWTEQGSLANIAPSIPGVRKLLGGAQSFLDAPKSVLNRVGFAEMGAIYQSKKIYSKSGYLDLSVSFKVINWNGQPENSPIHVALTLFSYMLPTKAFDIWTYLKKTTGDMKNKLQSTLKDAVESAKNGDFSLLNAASSTIGGATSKLTGMLPADIQSALGSFGVDLKSAWEELKTVPGNIGTLAKAEAKKFEHSQIDNAGITVGGLWNNIKYAADIGLEYMDDNFMLRKQPAQVKVRIGKFFENSDMIVENVNVNFSEEMTEEGPLWAEFTVKLSSRTIMYDISKVGFKIYANGEWIDVPPIDDPDSADMIKVNTEGNVIGAYTTVKGGNNYVTEQLGEQGFNDFEATSNITGKLEDQVNLTSINVKKPTLG